MEAAQFGPSLTVECNLSRHAQAFSMHYGTCPGGSKGSFVSPFPVNVFVFGCRNRKQKHGSFPSVDINRRWLEAMNLCALVFFQAWIQLVCRTREPMLQAAPFCSGRSVLFFQKEGGTTTSDFSRSEWARGSTNKWKRMRSSHETLHLKEISRNSWKARFFSARAWKREFKLMLCCPLLYATNVVTLLNLKAGSNNILGCIKSLVFILVCKSWEKKKVWFLALCLTKHCFVVVGLLSCEPRLPEVL